MGNGESGLAWGSSILLGTTGLYLSRSEHYNMLVIEKSVVEFDTHTSVGVHPGVRVVMTFGFRCKDMRRPRASHQSSHGINNPSLGVVLCCLSEVLLLTSTGQVEVWRCPSKHPNHTSRGK